MEFIRSPLHEKRIVMLLLKKQMFGRRAYTESIKVKPSSRQLNLYEKQYSKQNTENKNINSSASLVY